jgi:hypothetical protein
MYDNSSLYETGNIYRPLGFSNPEPAQSQFPVLPMTYRERMNYLNQVIVQQQKGIDQRLKDSFPDVYSYVEGGLLIFIGFLAFILQIILTVSQTPLSLFVPGIWSGFLCIAIGILCILLGSF